MLIEFFNKMNNDSSNRDAIRQLVRKRLEGFMGSSEKSLASPKGALSTKNRRSVRGVNG